MHTATELLDLIRRDPADEDALQIYADFLQQQGDSRGELVMLRQRERLTPGGLAELAALDRLIELVAEHGFT